MRRYIFTSRDRVRLEGWLETGLEDGVTLGLFVEVRRSLDRLVGDLELLRRVCVRLREEGRMAGRGRLPRGFGRRSPSGG